MKQLELRVETPEKMQDIGYLIGKLSLANMVITMNGELGAGKTTLTKGIGKALNIHKTINSPTFTIMKIYEGDLTLYHLDVYRVENVNDDFELEEYFYLGGLTVIEWADRIKSLIPDYAINLDFSILNNGERLLKINGYDEFIDKLEEMLYEKTIS